MVGTRPAPLAAPADSAAPVRLAPNDDDFVESEVQQPQQQQQQQQQQQRANEIEAAFQRESQDDDGAESSTEGPEPQHQEEQRAAPAPIHPGGSGGGSGVPALATPSKKPAPTAAQWEAAAALAEEEQHQAAVRLQAVRRGLIARRLAQRLRTTEAATVIQARWRGHHAVVMRAALIKKRQQQRQQQQQQQQQQQAAAVRLQAAVRGGIARGLAKRLRLRRAATAAIRIQARWRGHRAVMARELEELEAFIADDISLGDLPDAGLCPATPEEVAAVWGEAVAAAAGWRAAEPLLLPMAMEVGLDNDGLAAPPAPYPPLMQQPVEPVAAPAVVGSIVNQHGETVWLLDDNPRGLPVVELPTEEEYRHALLYGPAVPVAVPAAAGAGGKTKRRRKE